MSSSNHDTVIIGAGLTGLLLSHRLHLAGHKVTLLEARENLGGHFRRLSTVDFFPATNEVLDLLEWTRSVAPLPMQIHVREHRPELFDEGKWRPFAGFGETSFQSISELMPYSQTHEVVLEPTLEQLVRSAIEQLPIAAQTLSEVTSIQVQQNRVSEITINGDKTLQPETLIFTAHPGHLNDLIKDDGLPTKHRTRLAKTSTWTSVVLDLESATPLLTDEAIRIFNHNAKEFEPVVGRVFGTRSLWMTLVPADRSEEHEFIGQCIRHIKRQLKRAWPLEDIVSEKIYVHHNAFGQHSLKTKESFNFPEIRGLYLGNAILTPYAGALGSLACVQALEAALSEGKSEATHPEA